MLLKTFLTPTVNAPMLLSLIFNLVWAREYWNKPVATVE
jgi:hypothetical protein